MKIFYHDDMDGRAAAWCVNKWVENRCHLAMDFHPVHHLDGFDILDLNLIDNDEHVWLLDFSLSPKLMDELLEITRNITWVDHHKTAIEQFESSYFGPEIRGIRNVSVSACELTYMYIHHFTSDMGYGHDISPELTVLDFFDALKHVPFAIRLVGDRDCWTFKFKNITNLFHAGSAIQNTGPESSFWDYVTQWDEQSNQHFFDKILQDGETILEYKKSQDEWLNEIGFTCEFYGYKCFAINRPLIGSDRLGEIPKHFPIIAIFHIKKNNLKVGLRSTTVDVSKIAEQFGGGGHPGAAGFTYKIDCWPPPFFKYKE